MKFRATVVVDVTIDGARFPKDDLLPLVETAMEDALEATLTDTLYDAISVETDKEINVDSSVESVEVK